MLACRQTFGPLPVAGDACCQSDSGAVVCRTAACLAGAPWMSRGGRCKKRTAAVLSLPERNQPGWPCRGHVHAAASGATQKVPLLFPALCRGVLVSLHALPPLSPSGHALQADRAACPFSVLAAATRRALQSSGRTNLVRGGFQPRLPTSLPPPGQQQQPSPLPRRQPVPLMPPAQLHPGAPQVVAPAPAVPLQSPPPSELMDVDPSAGSPSQAVAVQPVLQPLSLGTPKESDTAAPCPARRPKWPCDLVRGGFQPRLPTSLPPPGQQQQPSPLPRRQPVPLMPPAQLHPGAPQVVAPAPAVPLQSPPPSELMDVDPSAGSPSQAVAVQPVLQPLSLGTPKESDTAAPCPARRPKWPCDLVRGGFQPRLPTSLPPPGQQQQPSPLPRRQPVPLMPPAQLHPGAPQVVAPAPAVPLQSPPPSELMDVDPSAGSPSQAVAVQPVLQPLSLGTPKESDTAAPCPAPTQQPSTQRRETLPLFVGPDAPSRPVPEAAPVVTGVHPDLGFQSVFPEAPRSQCWGADRGLPPTTVSAPPLIVKESSSTQVTCCGIRPLPGGGLHSA
ncbi:uncharacterized protein LOC126233746 [Schistocerca nitens]|uniref:uncharacterized protein LOC126233746 n=1 Tax=Schistocerca nitens TaxID=7011 RepID=UPI0021196955|nr:uncharacterized protein LOC126233746 [Schistocerca nitens]